MDDQRREYTARQYDSIRIACDQARQAHGTILLWSQAVLGTLFAAGLVAEASHAARFTIAARFVFGLLLPAIILGSGLAWAGEMIRMETIGLYLRAFERATWSREDADGGVATSWFVWENFIWSPPDALKSIKYGKQATAYAGVAVFYSVMYAGSLIVFCIISPWWLSLTDSALVVVSAAIIMVPPAIQVLRLGSTAPTITDKELAEWAGDLVNGRIGKSPTPLGYVRAMFSFRAGRI